MNDSIVQSPRDQTIFPLLQLPRELRNQIYHYAILIPDSRSGRALRIERRNLKIFRPSPAAILLILRHEYLLLNRQIAREALEVLFKRHPVFLSCGPFVLKCLLERIEALGGPGCQWLRWLNHIELDWITFPNLRIYPPDRKEGRDEWYCEEEGHELGEEYIYSAPQLASEHDHYDEYDHTGSYYDDNFYDPSDASLYPSFQLPTAPNSPNPSDPFGLHRHYPFTDPSLDPRESSLVTSDLSTKLDLLISQEVTPLFTYFASPTFNLTHITLPLYFVSKTTPARRAQSATAQQLTVRLRYWIHVAAHALRWLSDGLGSLRAVKVVYKPWDVWASLDSAYDLESLARDGIWYDDDDEAGANDDDLRLGENESGQGEEWRALWSEMENDIDEAGKGEERGRVNWEEGKMKGRFGLSADLKYVMWDGDVSSWRVGSRLEVVFRKAEQGLQHANKAQ